jgi:hypothetical protein
MYMNSSIPLDLHPGVQEWVERRLTELRRELAAGETRLDELEQHQMQIRDTLLRIGGAIQVLEEWRVLTGAIDESGADAAPTLEMANGRIARA